MKGYYCGKCQYTSRDRRCEKCGKPLSNATFRMLWTVVRVPVSDGIVWKSVMAVLLSVTGLLLLFTLLFCAVGNNIRAMTGAGLIPVILSVLPAGVLLTVITLSLQGRENVWYFLESTCAREQTWYRPSPLHSWSRFQTYRAEDAFRQADGSLLTLSKEKTIEWKDVCKVVFYPERARILLYHTPHVAPFTLRIPADEYESAENLIKKMCKGKY